MPLALASFSLNPTLASSGSVNMEYGTWRPVVTWFFAGEVIADDTKVIVADVRELWAAGNFTNRPRTGCSRLQPLIHLDVAMGGQLYACNVKSDAVGYWACGL